MMIVGGLAARELVPVAGLVDVDSAASEASSPAVAAGAMPVADERVASGATVVPEVEACAELGVEAEVRACASCLAPVSPVCGWCSEECQRVLELFGQLELPPRAAQLRLQMAFWPVPMMDWREFRRCRRQLIAQRAAGWRAARVQH